MFNINDARIRWIEFWTRSGHYKLFRDEKTVYLNFNENKIIKVKD